MRTIKEWQRAAYSLAVSKGFHDCRACRGSAIENRVRYRWAPCAACKGTGRVDPHKPTRIASRLALIHCEISEAVECVARGGMHVWFSQGLGKLRPNGDGTFGLDARTAEQCVASGWKPEGFPIELADVFLRVCDLAESLGVELFHRKREALADSVCTDPETISADLANLHAYVSDVYEADPDNRQHLLSYALEGLFDLAEDMGVDLLAMAELKHEYNKTRPIMHGGKVL